MFQNFPLPSPSRPCQPTLRYFTDINYRYHDMIEMSKCVKKKKLAGRKGRKLRFHKKYSIKDNAISWLYNFLSN